MWPTTHGAPETLVIHLRDIACEPEVFLCHVGSSRKAFVFKVSPRMFTNIKLRKKGFEFTWSLKDFNSLQHLGRAEAESARFKTELYTTGQPTRPVVVTVFVSIA